MEDMDRLHAKPGIGMQPEWGWGYLGSSLREIPQKPEGRPNFPFDLVHSGVQPPLRCERAMRPLNSAPSMPQVATESMPALLSPGLAQSLTEVGFLALDQRDWLRAQDIFSVLMAFRRQSEFPYVGMSMVELLQGRWEAAAHWAQMGLVQVPGSRALLDLRDMAAQRGVLS